MQHYDLVVIGSGPAGEKGAVQAAYFGKRVALIERSPVVGGAAANSGIPLKALRETALFMAGFRSRKLHGVDMHLRERATLRDFLAQEHALVRELRLKVSTNLDNHSVEVIPGEASFIDSHTIKVTHPTRPDRHLSGDIILIATGSRPFRPSEFPFDCEGVYDTTTFLKIFNMPRTMAIVGAGAIGCEYASVMALLGCRVTLVDARCSFLPFLDAEVATLLQQSLLEMGVEVLTGAQVREVTPGAPIGVALDNGRELRVDTLLVASGRVGNTETLALENAGLWVDERGLLRVDANFQTKQPHIYAAGDVIGFPALASSSMEQARMAMVHAFDLTYKKHAVRVLPYGLYSIPECSMVGDSEETAQARNEAYVVGRARYHDNVRGALVGDDAGFLKLLFRAEDMRLIGAHMIGEQAIELINVAVLAMQLDATNQAFIDACFNFPSLADLYKYATYDAMKRAQQGRITKVA